MTESELQAIREMRDKATGGSLSFECDGSYPWPYRICHKGEIIARTETWNDVVLFSHARADISALLAEIDRLQRELENARDKITWQKEMIAMQRMQE